MTDTRRSVSALLASLFQDGQPAGSISPNDIRDLVVSMQSVYGSCYISAPQVTAVATKSVLQKVAGTTTLQACDVEMDSGGLDNRLRYTGTLTRRFQIRAELSLYTATGNESVLASLYHYDVSSGSGALIPGTVMEVYSATVSSENVTVSLTGSILMDENDYVEVRIANNTSAAPYNVTVEKMILMAHSILV